MSASFVSSTGCDVINPAGFVQQNYIHRTHHCLRFLNLTLYCRSWPECILWIRSVHGQQSGDTLFKVVRSPGQKGINPIHQALDTKLINHSALFYHRRETTPETNGLRLIHYSRFLADRGRKSLLSYHLSSSSRERTSVCSTRDPPLVQFTERLLPVWSVYIWMFIGGINLSSLCELWYWSACF